MAELSRTVWLPDTVPVLAPMFNVSRSNSIAKELSVPSLLFVTTVKPLNVNVTSSPEPPLDATSGAPGRLPPKPATSTLELFVTKRMPVGILSTTVRLVIVASGSVTVSRYAARSPIVTFDPVVSAGPVAEVPASALAITMLEMLSVSCAEFVYPR